MLHRRNLTAQFGALALAGFFAVGANSNAQPPVPTASLPAAREVQQLPLNATVGDTTGMISLPVKAVALATGDAAAGGQVVGRLSQGGTGLVGRNVYLADGANKIIAVARTGADGGFELSAPRTGDFTFLAGQFDGRTLERIGAANVAVNAPLTQKAAGRALVAVGGPPVEFPIGTAPALNDRVVFGENQFTSAGAKRYAGNEFAILDKGVFRGIVTLLDNNGVRRPAAGANLYVIRDGAILQTVTTAGNGAFSVSGLNHGAYTVVATIGSGALAQAPIPVGVGDVPVVPVAAAPLVSPYFAGAVAGVNRTISVRFPFEAVAVQRILLKDGPGAGVAAEAIGGNTAEFQVKGAADVAINVAFTAQEAGEVPVINLTPAPWVDLRPLFGVAEYDTTVALPPTPVAGMGFEGGGFGGGGGGGGFGGAGALAGLAAAAAIAAASSRGGGGNNTVVASPFRP